MMLKNLRLLILASSVIGAAIPAYAENVGFSDGVPLKDAARRIVPQNYKVDIAPNVNGSKLVVWSDGGWRQAITTAAKNAGASVTIVGETVKIFKVSEEASERAEVDRPVATRSGRATRLIDAGDRPRTRVVHTQKKRKYVKRHSSKRYAGSTTVVEGETISASGFVLIPENAASRQSVVGRRGSKGPSGIGADPSQALSGQQWIVRSGDSLRSVLTEWTNKSGWTLVWESQYSYTLTSSAKFEGDFVTASGRLMRSMSQVRPVVTATFFRGNRTLVVNNNAQDEAGN